MATGLGNGLKKIEYFVKQPAKGIHSERHALAKEISEFCGEPKKFGMYLGIIKNIGLPRTYRIFAELKQAKEIKTPGKLFLYLSAYKPLATFGKPKVARGKPKNGNHKRAGKNTPEKIKKRRKDNTGN
ncbi:MAG: hypothetical protein HYX20_00500 [Candidatus Yanofskybacteria bacterium]|nr:hypothetical protein [Candidatus Yanofskybacteria bacterium]